MAIEVVLVKPIVDAILAALKSLKNVKVRKDASAELTKVIHNLIQISPDITNAEVKIRAAKAAGVISKELVLAEEMLSSVKAKPRAAAKKISVKNPQVVPRVVAKKPVSKKGSAITDRKPRTAVAAKQKPAPESQRGVLAVEKRKPKG